MYKLQLCPQPTITKISTINYRAPETFVLEPKWSTESDIFSFGMLIFEVITRTIPFGDKNASEVQTLICNKQKPTLVKGPLYLQTLMNKCLEYDPVKRPNIDQVLHALSYKPALIIAKPRFK